MTLRRFAILSSAFASFSTTAPAFAGTLVVDNDFAECPQADFNSIQAAVVGAKPGDKILACPGHYLETVEVTKPICGLKLRQGRVRWSCRPPPRLLRYRPSDFTW